MAGWAVSRTRFTPFWRLRGIAKLFESKDAMKRALECGGEYAGHKVRSANGGGITIRASGEVASMYPVFSVHQDAMAPMVLFAVGEVTGEDFREPIYKGLEWIGGANELGTDLRDTTNNLVWRRIHPVPESSMKLDVLMSHFHVYRNASRARWIFCGNAALTIWAGYFMPSRAAIRKFAEAWSGSSLGGKSGMPTNTRTELADEVMSTTSSKPAKIMIVVGARPNFMKAAPLIAAIRAYNQKAEKKSGAEKIRPVLVHTGQHYDEAMSGSFFTDLKIPKPDVYLGVGSGSHAAQTAEIMRRFEEVLLNERPDALILVGDVNSTVACALVAAKISFDSQGSRPLIAHVEAGLRSFDKGMPEEVNRILTDHLSDLLFVTEESGIQNLLHEGIPQEKIHLVGNTMIDSLLAFQDQADNSSILSQLGLRQAGASGTPTAGSVAATPC